MGDFPEKPDFKAWRSWPVSGAIVGLPWVVYLASLWTLSQIRSDSPWSLVCFQPESFPAANIAEKATVILTALGACGVLFAAPLLLGMLIFRSGSRRRSSAAVWSAVLNSSALMASCLVLRWTMGISRLPFLAAWLGWSICLAVWAGRHSTVAEDFRGLWRRHRHSLWWGLGTVAGGVLLFGRHQFLSCFEGDGVESFELAYSLREHFLPTWENEPINRFGAVIVNPALVNSYWTMALQQLLGATEFATRLPFWVYWLGVFVALCRLRQRFGEGGWGSRLVFSLGVLLIAQWYTFYVGYDAYMADIANPGVPDAMFTLFLILALGALLEGDLSGWVMGIVLGSLVLYAGPVMLVLTAFAALIWQPVERLRLLRAATAGSGLLLWIGGLYLAWGWWTGMLEGWWATFQSEYLLSYYAAPIPRTRLTLLYAGYFLLGIGGVAAVSLVDSLRRTPWERTVATAVAAYLLIVLGSAEKNLHYLGPLIPLVLLLWVIPDRDRGREWRAGLASAGLCASLVLCWPPTRPVFTLTRDFGKHTTFETDSYQEACRWADLAVVYDLGVTSWEVPPHTWVRYSALERRPAKRRAILVTAGGPPPGYVVRAVESQTGVKVCLDLYSPEVLTWAATRDPLTGPERFPAVLRDIAIKPRPKLPFGPARNPLSPNDREAGR